MKFYVTRGAPEQPAMEEAPAPAMAVSAEPKQPGQAAGVIRQVAQGALLGWADELAGLVKSKTEGVPYDEALAQIRSEMEAYRKDNPLVAGGTELAGSMATGVIGAPAKVKAGAQTFANVVQGLASGAGSAEEGEHTAGAATGTGLALAVPKVFSGLGKMVGRIAEKFGITDSEGLASIMRALYRDKTSVAEVEAKLAQRGPGAVLAEGGGENVGALAQSVGTQPGAGRQIAKEALAEQEAGAVPRMMGSAQTAAGTTMRAGEGLAQIEKRLQETAEPLYQKAWPQPIKLDKDMVGIINTPTGRRAWEEARIAAKDERRALPKPEKFDVKAADDMKLGFDRVIEQHTDAVTGKMDRAGYRALKLKNEWLAKVDVLSPDYAKARSTWGGEASKRTALKEGQNFLKEGHDATSDFLKTATAGEKEMFTVGAVESIRDKILNSPFPGSAAARLAKTPATKEKLTTLLGKEKADALIASLKMEGERREFSNKILGGSRTAPLLQAEKELAQPITPGDIASAAGDPVRAATGIVGRLLGGGGENEPRRTAIASALFASTPEAQRNAFGKLSAKERALNQMRQRLLGTGLGTSTFATQETMRQ